MLIPIYVGGYTLQMPYFDLIHSCVSVQKQTCTATKRISCGQKKGRIFANIFKGLRKRAHFKLRERRE